ncbi:MAG: hypothetical protein ISS66_12230 [Desulfobacteraceae bacterium]|nr:hypothetical protein [Desulfobacteraceae bacterium]
MKFITAQPARGGQARRTIALAAVTVSAYRSEAEIPLSGNRLNDQG